MNKKLSLFFVVACVILVFLVHPIRATPLISWAPSSFTQEVTAGASITSVVTATALGTLPNATVGVSSELAGFVTVTPSDPGTVPRRKSIELTIDVKPPATMSPGTIEGTITLYKKDSNGTAFGPTLPVKIVVKWPTVASDGAVVSYPASWSLDQKTLNLSETIRLTNFGTSYLHGGIVPDGGAQISVLAIPLADNSMEDVVAQDTEGDQVRSVDDVEIAGSLGKRVTFDIDFGGDLRYRRVAVYVPRGSQLHKFILDYRLGDPSEAQFQKAFADVLDAVTFN